MKLSVRKMIFIMAPLLIIAFSANIISFILLSNARDSLTAAEATRYNSYLLADELRQSSDDLTRLARTYVVTGDAKYEAQYWDVLAIRNGQKPRPLAYHRIYWDFVAATGTKPRNDGPAVPLQTLMEQAGFTAAEFGKLKQAQANSDGLVKLETRAMNAVKGQFDDGRGNYTVKKEPDFELARNLMHSKEYHTFKSEIMAPVDEFYVLLEQRTQGAIDAAERNVAFYHTVNVTTLALLGLILALAGWILVARVSAPLDALKVAMTRLSRNDHGVTIPCLDRSDEIGEMARATDVFKRGLEEAETARSTQQERDRRQEEEKRRTMAKLADEFEASVSRMVSEVRSATGSVQEDARALSATAQDASHQSDSMSAAALHATENVEGVAAAAEELAASVAEIARQVSGASSVARNAVSEANATNESVKGLAATAQRIGDVVNLIQVIASQTNLLALNATIEAARAGEAGKGFAVVASEVKNLANQTAKATEDIQAQVSAIQEETAHAVQAIDSITRTIGNISTITVAVASAVEEQGAATQEITRNAQEAARGTRGVSANVGGVTDAADRTRRSADTLLAAADTLSRQSAALNTEVDGFVRRVRQP
ncbi:methyl-accepting chemotaxis protein [Azospirillum sp. B510]|uniref:methyl-accepting chemotaxis protein n=1 Tax=Azospirillum sp. (strain B510) TaxID=137722 RepID=UPI00068DDC02